MKNQPALHRLARAASVALFLPLTLLVLSGCDDEADPTDGQVCPRGTVLIDGECQRLDGGQGGGGGATGDPGGTGGPEGTGGQPTGSNTPGGSNGPSGIEGTPPGGGGDLACAPGEVYCATPRVLATCNEAGDGHARERTCGDNEVCRQREGGAACILGTVDSCEPGSFVSCSGTNAFIECSPDGFADNDNPRQCPAATPNCRTGLGCTDAICTPGATLCEGNQVRRCNAEGSDTDFVQDCPSGCAGGACFDPCADDGKGSYVGCDFFAVHLDNYVSPCQGPGDCRALDAVCQSGRCTYTAPSTNRFGVTVSNVTANPVTITVFDGDNNQVLEETIGPRALSSLPIPVPAGIREGTRVDNNTYRIESTGAITVHQFNPPNNVGAFSNDASLLLPTNGLGTDYLVLGWPTISVGGGLGGATFLRSYAAVIAVSEDPTEVTITSPVAVRAGDGIPALSANQPWTTTLQRGQVLHLYTTDTANADLSGMRIRSTEPVAAFAGNQCANVPGNIRYCDHMEQQLYPTDTWGSDFIIAKFRPRGTERDMFRIMALEGMTELITSPRIDGVDGRTLGAGEVLEFQESRNFEVRGRNGMTGAAAPISVAQFMTGSNSPGVPSTCPSGCGGALNPCSTGIGDPAFLLNVPTRQFLSEYVFFVPSQYAENYISIIARDGTSLQLNNSPVSAPPQNVSGTPYSVYHVAVQPGVNTLTADRAVGLYVYGYDCDVSYAYPGGMNLEIDAAANF